MLGHEQVREYPQVLDHRVELHVRMTIRDGALVNYALVLKHQPLGEPWHAVRVYDYTHGVHDEHRCDRAGQTLPAQVFHHGGIQEGFEYAKSLIRAEYVTMIDAWLAQPPM